MYTRIRLKISQAGVLCLKVFLVTVTFLAAGIIISAFNMLPERWVLWLTWTIVFAAVEFLLFWTGIICVYATSVQLGIKIRVLGALFGMVPIINIIFLIKIIKTVSKEISFEREKLELNQRRKNLEMTKTVYPLLLVHGVFFRDYKMPGYWGRIPSELRANGAQIYFGGQQSAASVADSGRELAERIKSIVKETGCKKVNVIAHSKGGLDIIWAVENCGIGDMVASVSTINTPHRGCEFADYLLNKLPVKMQKRIENTYNTSMKRLGDQNPDFMSAVKDLTAEACRKKEEPVGKRSHGAFNGIFCQSVGSKLNKASGGKFPLNFTYNLVKYFDGPNDGLVAESSFEWGERYTFLTTDGKRGISHGDMIDLNRENIDGFDVREFYVELVSGLKARGL